MKSQSKVQNIAKSFILLSVLTLFITGCGGGSSTSSTTQPEQKKIDIKSDFKFMSDFLAALKSSGVDCTGYVKDDEVIGVLEQGSCTYGSTELTLDLFADDKTASMMVDSLKAFGGYWVVSNNWVIVVEDGDVAKDLRDKLGATIA
jgi:hypothetical protein